MNQMNNNKQSGFTRAPSDGANGFTLIEILVVIGMIALLATIVLIAINPARQFAQGRNTQRSSNVNAILNAIGQNIADNKGILMCSGTAEVIPTASSTIGAGSSCTGSCVNYRACIQPTYIGEIPLDPQDGKIVSSSDYTSGYQILRDATTNRITVFATSTELGVPLISVTR